MWQRSISLATIGAIVLLTVTAARAKPPSKTARAGDPAASPSVSANAPPDRFVEPTPQPDVSGQYDPQILNHDEMLSLIRKYAAEIVEAVALGESERNQAMRAKDAIKLTCIQERLANLKIMKRLSDERLAASERPRIRGDELNLRHEFRGVELGHQRVLQLRRELLGCAGESLEVSVGYDRLPTVIEDPTGAHVPPPPVDRPPPASPYK
jgi:hypothetical protein